MGNLKPSSGILTCYLLEIPKCENQTLLLLLVFHCGLFKTCQLLSVEADSEFPVHQTSERANKTIGSKFESVILLVCQQTPSPHPIQDALGAHYL